MRAIQKKSKIYILALALLASFLLTSCGVIDAARSKIVSQVNAGAEATPTPSPTPRPVETSSLPILERELSENPFSLISDRLLIRMPVGTEDDPRQPDVMGAERSNQGETRLVLEGNGQQMVVYAKEAFYLVDDLQAESESFMKLWYGDSFAYRPDPVRQSGDGLTLMCFSPEKIDTSTEAVLIRGAIIRTGEGALIALGVYVTPETASDIESCQKQADRILESIEPGARKIELSAHEEIIDDAYRITLDDGYVLIQETGADFSVYYIQKVTKLNEPAPSIGIYIGGHPTRIYPQRGIDDSQLTTTKDTILKTSVEWLCYKPDPQKEYYSAETVFALPLSIDVMHIFVDAADEADFLKIKEMIKTLKRK